MGKRLVPLADHLVIRPIKDNEEKVLKSGIVIPGTAGDKPQVAEVVAIGEDVTRVETGEEVMYAQYAGQHITVGQVEYVVLAEDEILCKVKD